MATKKKAAAKKGAASPVAAKPIKNMVTKSAFVANPFTGQETTFGTKPARVKVKVRPMKKLKDAAKA